MTSDQMAVIRPTTHDLTVGTILHRVGNTASTVRIAQRQLNNLGEINAYCTRTNDVGRLKKLKNVLELAATIGRVKERSATAKKAKPEAADDDLRAKGQSGLAKLVKANTVDPAVAGLYADEIRGVALVHVHHRIEKAKKALSLPSLTNLHGMACL